MVAVTYAGLRGGRLRPAIPRTSGFNGGSVFDVPRFARAGKSKVCLRNKIFLIHNSHSYINSYAPSGGSFCPPRGAARSSLVPRDLTTEVLFDAPLASLATDQSESVLRHSLGPHFATHFYRTTIPPTPSRASIKQSTLPSQYKFSARQPPNRHRYAQTHTNRDTQSQTHSRINKREQPDTKKWTRIVTTGVHEE